MADIFREVDEELRRERASDLWRRYGTYILAAAVLIVLATAGFVAWREWRQAQLQAQGAEFFAVAEQAAKGPTPEAAAALSAFAAKADDGYAMLARLDEAGVRAKQGDTAGAVALYERIAGDGGVPQTYRDLAVILMGLNGFETLSPAAMLPRLAPLTADTNPMRFSALELTALFERKAGNAARARDIFQQLSNNAAAPGPMRERAREMLDALPGGASLGGSSSPGSSSLGNSSLGGGLTVKGIG